MQRKDEQNQRDRQNHAGHDVHEYIKARHAFFFRGKYCCFPAIPDYSAARNPTDISRR
jgi:hypothetical protein